MAKRVRDATLESKEARRKLEPRGKPYYRALGPGLHLGYRKSAKGGRWVARMYVGDRDYRMETMADADDQLDANAANVLDFNQAQDRARALHMQLASGGAKVSKVYSVADAIGDYLEWMEGNRKSARDARYRADALILPDLGAKDVAKLTATDIRRWLRKVAETPPRVRVKKGADPKFRDLEDDPEAVRRRRATANRTLTILKAALNYAWREGRANDDGAWRRVEPFEAVDSARVHYLTVAEAQRLLNTCEPEFRRLVQAALQTGARYGELAALRVVDFIADAGVVAIRASKSNKARHIVLTDEGVDFFATVIAGRAGTERMFSNPSGDVWGKSHQARPMIEACKRAKISPPIGFHGLRHTWASLAVMAGVPLMVVSRNLGHADTRMVEKHYGHLAPSYIADAIRAGAPRFGKVGDENVKPMARAGR